MRGQQQALNNTQDGVNVLNIVDGALSVIQDNLQRMRELAVQAANDTNGSNELAAIKTELTELQNNINQVANSTSYNGINLLDGSSGSVRIQIGANTSSANDTVEISTALGSGVYSALVASSTATFGSVGTTDISTASSEDIRQFVATLDQALNVVSSRRSTSGAYVNRLESAAQNLAVGIENRSASLSRITSADVAKESANMTQLQILQQAGATVLSQANQAPSLALSLLRG